MGNLKGKKTSKILSLLIGYKYSTCKTNILSWLGGSFMNNYDYWSDFIKTGKIDDYLNYIACTKEEISDYRQDVNREKEVVAYRH